MSARTKAKLAKEGGTPAGWNGAVAETAKKIDEIKSALGGIKSGIDEVAEDNMAVLEAVRRASEAEEAFRSTLLKELDKLRAGLSGELYFHALRSTCRELGSVLSALERMLKAADFSDIETTRQHVASFATSLEGALRRLGIERLPVAEGADLFDARFHECVKVCPPAESPFPEAPPRTIVRVEENGYLVQGRPAVPARVWVQQETETAAVG